MGNKFHRTSAVTDYPPIALVGLTPVKVTVTTNHGKYYPELEAASTGSNEFIYKMLGLKKLKIETNEGIHIEFDPFKSVCIIEKSN
jgi:hypothetical protein